MSQTAEPVQIEVNGAPRLVASGQSLPELVASLGLPPAGVLIEHNGLALLRDEWACTRLAAGDRLEILRVVAGG